VEEGGVHADRLVTQTTNVCVEEGKKNQYKKRSVRKKGTLEKKSKKKEGELNFARMLINGHRKRRVIQKKIVTEESAVFKDQTVEQRSSMGRLVTKSRLGDSRGLEEGVILSVDGNDPGQGAG